MYPLKQIIPSKDRRKPQTQATKKGKDLYIILSNTNEISRISGMLNFAGNKKNKEKYRLNSKTCILDTYQNLLQLCLTCPQKQIPRKDIRTQAVLARKDTLSNTATKTFFWHN